MAEFKPGDQILYIPFHANGDETHQDCEFGFVTSVRKAADTTIVFCRFWYKVIPGKEPYLRTKANSESCASNMLIHKRSVDPEFVEKAWRMYVKLATIPKESDGK